jgi:hypothetical protein
MCPQSSLDVWRCIGAEILLFYVKKRGSSMQMNLVKFNSEVKKDEVAR